MVTSVTPQKPTQKKSVSAIWRHKWGMLTLVVAGCASALEPPPPQSVSSEPGSVADADAGVQRDTQGLEEASLSSPETLQEDVQRSVEGDLAPHTDSEGEHPPEDVPVEDPAQDTALLDATAPEDTESEQVSGATLCTDYGPPEVQGNLPPNITEASGLAVSPTQPGVLWMHNDSGDAAKLYAVQTTGERLATIRLDDMWAYDWEDMAAGPCEASAPSSSCLYVGDIGDNHRVRNYLKLHRLVEPDVTLGDQLLAKGEYDTMTVAYPDEPHDCEGLVVDAQGYVYLITKEWDAPKFRVYATAYLPGATEAPLQFLSEHDISDLGGTAALVTAASLSLPLNRLLLRTYSAVIAYQLPPGATLSELPWATAYNVPVANEAQGEAIDFGPEGYWHVSEGKGPPIWHVPCQ